jgi:hypothetical protein
MLLGTASKKVIQVRTFLLQHPTKYASMGEDIKGSFNPLEVGRIRYGCDMRSRIE